VCLIPIRSGAAGFQKRNYTIAKKFSVLFCRLYFAATSGVCLIRSGAAGFQKKLQSHKKVTKEFL
jgi:hypothetical protein